MKFAIDQHTRNYLQDIENRLLFVAAALRQGDLDPQDESLKGAAAIISAISHEISDVIADGPEVR